MIQMELNTPVNYQLLGEVFSSEQDLKLVWPEAHYPLDIQQWIEWFSHHENSETQSIFFRKDEDILGHCTLKVCHLSRCISIYHLIVVERFRNQGYLPKIINVVESYIKRAFPHKDIVLEIPAHHQRLIQSYLKSGYQVIKERPELIDLKKTVQ